MSFFKKVMANVLGVGGCKVDTIIDNTELSPGQTISGVIRIYGGSIQQHINGINLIVRTKYEKELKDKKMILTSNIQKHTVTVGRSILEEENLEIPFSFKLNDNCPISTYKYKVWISTVLDIANAVDSGDGDHISVIAGNEMQNILDALSSLGFKNRETENIFSLKSPNSMPFVQEFEFIATKAPFKGKLDELEIIFSKNIYGIDLYLEIDRKAHSIGSLFAEKLNLDESKVRIEIENKDLNNIHAIKDKLFNVINRHS